MTNKGQGVDEMLPVEIYVHIPFCIKKCAYCDFLSAPSTAEEREAYVALLCREIEAARGRLEGYSVTSIFFGGGTPSLLTGKQLAGIMESLRESFVIAGDCEITLEMNPGTVTEEKLAAYRRAGVNRLSIGLQSVHDDELRMLGRIHTYKEFQESYRLARKAGFYNINVDLISAIPGQTEESWRDALRAVADLKPEHISAYSLIIEPGTPFYEIYGEDTKRRAKELPDEEEERLMYRQTKELLEEAGYERYEISNYARPGYACRHNLGYWERVPYLGFGIGAASLIPACGGSQGHMSRYTNPETIQEYQISFYEKFKAGPLSREEEMEEFMFLGLRKTSGISKAVFSEYFHCEIREIYGAQIDKLKRLGLLQENGGNVRLTERGIDVSNAVFVEFMFG